MSHLLWYTLPMIMNDKQNNYTTHENIVLACGEETLRDAQVSFRQRQHQAGRGTTESDYAKLDRYFERVSDQEKV